MHYWKCQLARILLRKEVPGNPGLDITGYPLALASEKGAKFMNAHSPFAEKEKTGENDYHKIMKARKEEEISEGRAADPAWMSLDIQLLLHWRREPPDSVKRVLPTTSSS